jgi:hypothetical protein
MSLLFILVLLANFNKATPTSGTADENHPSLLSLEEHDKGRGVHVASGGTDYDEIGEQFQQFRISLAAEYIAEVKTNLSEGWQAADMDPDTEASTTLMAAIGELQQEFERLPKDWRDDLGGQAFSSQVQSLEDNLPREIRSVVNDRRAELVAEYEWILLRESGVILKEVNETLNWWHACVSDIQRHAWRRFDRAVQVPKGLKVLVELKVAQCWQELSGRLHEVISARQTLAWKPVRGVLVWVLKGILSWAGAWMAVATLLLPVCKWFCGYRGKLSCDVRRGASIKEDQQSLLNGLPNTIP